MGKVSLGDVDRALREPKSIFAPDGTRFTLVAKINEDAMSVEHFFRPDFVGYEVTGPDLQAHVWIFNHLLEVLPDPDHEDVPRLWTLKADIAISGWIQLNEQAEP